jgi:hypothetical protein
VTAPMRGSVFGDIDIHGDSSQSIVGTQVSGDVIQSMNTFVRGRPSMYLGSEKIADRVRCYVAADNHDLIVKALEIDHAVILVGPLGCGRETTAIAAIDQLRPGASIRRFSLEDEDAEEIYAKGGGYLVHAADGELSRLGSCVDAVRASGGYLVVIGNAETERASVAIHLPSITVEPPQPIQVYRRRVTLLGLTEWLHWDGAPALLEHALPADARRLIHLIEQIDRRGGDVAARREEAVRAYRGWKDELCGWFDDHREPHERALLVAAATLSPAEEANVYTVASSLARRLEITMNGAGLAWYPATGLRDLLGAEPQDDRIVFRRHGFAMSALRHALADYPLARSDLLSWLAALPTDDAVPYELRSSLAETFADMAAEYGPAELIIETARKWGAADLADLSFIALTRLKHLATHGNRQVLGEVILAARALATGGHRVEVLTAALAWSAETNRENLSHPARQRRRRAGAMLFLELARPVSESGLPVMLEGDPTVDPAPGWRAGLDIRTAALGTGDDAFEEVARRWLDAALNHAHVRQRIIWIFIKAATPSGVPSGAAYGMGPAMPGPTAAKIMIGMVRRWAAEDHTDPVRKKIKEDIVIPLTRPWWLRLLKILYVHLRTLAKAARQH